MKKHGIHRPDQEYETITTSYTDCQQKHRHSRWCAILYPIRLNLGRMSFSVMRCQTSSDDHHFLGYVNLRVNLFPNHFSRAIEVILFLDDGFCLLNEICMSNWILDNSNKFEMESDACNLTLRGNIFIVRITSRNTTVLAPLSLALSFQRRSISSSPGGYHTTSSPFASAFLSARISSKHTTSSQLYPALQVKMGNKFRHVM